MGCLSVRRSVGPSVPCVLTLKTVVLGRRQTQSLVAVFRGLRSDLPPSPTVFKAWVLNILLNMVGVSF